MGLPNGFRLCAVPRTLASHRGSGGAVADAGARRDTDRMDDAEVVRLLKERGYTLGDSAVREDGVLFWQVNETLMFRRDAVDPATLRRKNPGSRASSDLRWPAPTRRFPIRTSPFVSITPKQAPDR